METIRNLKKVLFINFGGIGDEILFFPTLDDFKKSYPDCEIHLLLEPRSSGCASLTHTIDRIIEYDVKIASRAKVFFDLLFIIKKGGYDAVISAGSNMFISLLLFLSGVKIRVGYDSGPLSRKLLSTAVALNKAQYAANMYHDLLKGAGIDREAPLPEVVVNSEALAKADQMLGEKDKPHIVIHPGVSSLSIKKNIIKSWPEQNWAELICSLLKSNKFNVVLAGGPDDESTILEILSVIENKGVDTSNLVNLYGKTRSLVELAALIKQSQLLLCVDSAPMHIGVGVNTKIVAIFGPTDEKKLLPPNKDFIALKNIDLTCRPCLWDKQNQVCHHTSCLNVSVQAMLDAVDAQQIH